MVLTRGQWSTSIININSLNTRNYRPRHVSRQHFIREAAVSHRRTREIGAIHYSNPSGFVPQPYIEAKSNQLIEIDHNFSRAHRIVTSSILPIVEQYADHSKAVWDGSKVSEVYQELRIRLIAG
jgi:hypothetical protein